MNNLGVLQNNLHPDLRKALDSVSTPAVQDLIRKLSNYGLGVFLPHMHDEDGTLVPLPYDRVVHEVDLRVSFPHKDSSDLSNSIPVMWRSNGDKISIGGKCCDDPFPAGKCCSGKIPTKK